MSVTVLAIVMCIGLPTGLAFIAWFTDSGRDLGRRLSYADYHWLGVGLVFALEHPADAERLLPVVEARAAETKPLLEREATAVEAQLMPAA